MAISLKSLKKESQMAAPRMVVYGPQKIGKSTFAATAPDGVFIQTEDGLSGIETTHFPLAKSYSEVIDAITSLYSEDHEFKTVVVDSLDWLEPLIWKHTAQQHGKDEIEDFGYGKGYVLAATYWQEFLAGLNALRTEKNMAVILLAHHEIKRFDAPDTDPYDRYQIKLHKTAAALVQEWADVIGFANYKVMTTKTEVGFDKKVTRAIGTGERLIAPGRTPRFCCGQPL